MINAVRNGDTTAFRTLYDRYCGRVYALCYRLTGDTAMAEDATQEVFIQVWRKIDTYREESRFSTWLHSVTTNSALQYLRRNKNWLPRFRGLVDGEAAERVAEPELDIAALDACLVHLPERMRLVFVLHAIEGYRHEEIAGLLNVAVATSKSHFHRAKSLLIERLGP